MEGWYVQVGPNNNRNLSWSESMVYSLQDWTTRSWNPNGHYKQYHDSPSSQIPVQKSGIQLCRNLVQSCLRIYYRSFLLPHIYMSRPHSFQSIQISRVKRGRLLSSYILLTANGYPEFLPHGFVTLNQTHLPWYIQKPNYPRLIFP